MVVGRAVRALRRLLYCGEWIQSHALHVYLLHAPDFLGCDDAVDLAETDPAALERGLRLKRTGNQLMAAVGGRAVHPVNVRVGGFYRAPRRPTSGALAEPLRRARDDALATVEWVAGFDFPDVEADYRFVALHDPAGYAIEAGAVRSSDGLDVDAAGVRRPSWSRSTRPVPPRCTPASRVGTPTSPVRWPVSPSTARSCPRSPGRRPTAPGSGPCAATRSAASSCAPSSWSSPATRRCASSRPTSRRTRRRRRSRRDPGPAPGATEAPRGLLLHRYELDADGDDRRGADHGADVAEPADHRRGPAPGGPGRLDAVRRRADPALRAGGAQPRPVHLVRRPLPRRGRGPAVTARALVVGIGNDYRRDDGVGPTVVRRVAARLDAVGRRDVDVIDGIPDPLDLLGRWDGATLVVVVDAVRSGAPAGTVSVIELSGGPSPDGPDPLPFDGGARTTSTHGMGVVSALRLARALGQAPDRVVLVAVAGADFGRGEGLGPAVAGAVPEAVGRILALVGGSADPG